MEKRPGLSPQRLLVIQTAFLGDLVLLTPLLEALRQGLGSARIALLARPEGAEILGGSPALDEILVYDKRGRDKGPVGFLRVVRRVRRMHFNCAVIPHRSLRSALLASLAGIPNRVGFETSAGAFLLTHRVAPAGAAHEVERNLRLASPLGLEASPRPPRLFPGAGAGRRAREFLMGEGIGEGEGFAAIAPGSLWPTKRWVEEGYAAVTGSLAEWLPVVLLGGPEDRPLAGRIRDAAVRATPGKVDGTSRRPSRPVAVAAGVLSPPESAALLSRARVLLTNDSAPAHMAAAVGTPVVVIFGPTSPRFGFAPYGPGHRIVQRELPCRPCRIHGGRRCPLRHFRCMREIGPGEVLEAIGEVLGVAGGEWGASGGSRGAGRAGVGARERGPRAHRV